MQAKPTERHRRITDNLGLARKVARNWARKKGLPYEELLQIATEGLIKGIDRHVPEKGSFSTFILKYCNGEILHFLRDRLSLIKIPRTLQERGQKLISTRTQLTAEWGRTPTRSELAEHLKLTVQEVDDATLAMSNYFELGSTEDIQLSSKENKGIENSDRLTTIFALVKAMDIAALDRVLESGKLGDTEAMQCQAAIEELCDFIAPIEVIAEVVELELEPEAVPLDNDQPLLILPATGQRFKIDRIEGEQIIVASGEAFPLYNVELNEQAIALMSSGQLSKVINLEDSLARVALGAALYRANKAGRYLLAQKSRLNHGEWLPWVAQYCPNISDRSVQCYMRVAGNWDAIIKSAAAAGFDLKELSIQKALELIGSASQPKPERHSGLPRSLSSPNTFWQYAVKVEPYLDIDDWELVELNQLLKNLDSVRAKVSERLSSSAGST